MWRFFKNLFIIQTQVCIFLDAFFTGTSFEALARQENIYSGMVNTDMLWCLYYLGVHVKLALWKKSDRHVIYLIYSIKAQGGRRAGTMTVAKSQGRETCWVGGRKFLKGPQTRKKERCIKIKCVMLFGCRCFGNKILLTRELGTMSTIGTSLWQEK